MTIRIVVGIDVEPDPRILGGPDESHWEGWRATQALIRQLRERVARGQKQAPTFSWMLRMDPQIARTYGHCGWIADRFRPELDRIAAEGDDIGLHTHLFRWDESAGTWFTDNESAQWRRRCVTDAVTAFREQFGRDCVSHSFGDRMLSDDAVELLEAEGLLIDMTVEPGMVAMSRCFPNEELRGGLPDFSGAPRRLWRPAAGDFRQEDASGTRRLRLLPVATYRFPFYFEPGRRIALTLRRWSGDPPSDDDWTQRYLRIGVSQRRYLFRRACRLLMAEHAPPTLHFVMRTSQALEPAARERVLDNLEWLARGGLGRPVEFLSAARLLAEVDTAATPSP